MKISEYFKEPGDNLKCSCGKCGMLPRQDALEKLYALRILYGKPITVTSGARCDSYNSAIGGAANSKHRHGIAFDCVVPREHQHRLIRLAIKLGFTGIGIAKSFTHLDLREVPTVWVY